MKKQKLKNYLRIGVLILGVSLFFQSCSKDAIIDLQEFNNNNLIVESVSLIEIENNPLFSSIISTKSSKIDIYKSKTSSTSKSTNDYSILTDDISKASYKEYEAYTFMINNPCQPLFTFDNYVIQKNHDGIIEEFILRYEYDQLEFVKNGTKKFLSISKYDTSYNFISSDENDDENPTFSKNSSLSARASGGCTVTTMVYHRIPDGREFVFTEGSVCQHPGECDVVIEYTINCPPGGGGSGNGDGSGTSGPGGGGSVPDNGGTSTPITTMQPPAGQIEGYDVIEVLTDIIEEPLSRIPSEGEINQKTSALIGYLMETNQPVFQDLSILLAINLYDSNLNVTDRTNLWLKSRAIYDLVKNNNPTSPTTFNMFFSSLDSNEQESYTKNTMETALFSSVKSIVGEFWPQNGEEWGVLFKLMGPLLLEIGIEFLPGGGVFNSGKDALAGLSSGDYTAAVIGVVGIIMEFVPWAKLAKIATKIYDIGKSAFKIFKIAYNFLASIATAIENGIKTVLDSSGILRLIDNSGNQVAEIQDNVIRFLDNTAKSLVKVADLKLLDNVAPSSGGNIGKTVIDEKALKIKPDNSDYADDIADIINNGDPSGNKTEALMQDLLHQDGYQAVPNPHLPSNQGFDNVLIKRDNNGNITDVIINESKQVSNTGSISLSSNIVGCGNCTQMSNGWIDYTMDRMRQQGGNLETLADEIDNFNGTITQIVSGVNKNTGELVIVNITGF